MKRFVSVLLVVFVMTSCQAAMAIDMTKALEIGSGSNVLREYICEYMTVLLAEGKTEGGLSEVEAEMLLQCYRANCALSMLNTLSLECVSPTAFGDLRPLMQEANDILIADFDERKEAYYNGGAEWDDTIGKIVSIIETSMNTEK